MKQITKGVLVALCLFSQFSYAELQVLEDEQMSGLTGQSGLTIDIDMAVEIGEFMYKDAGSIVMQGIRIGGMDHTGDVGTSFDASVGIVADLGDPSGQGGGTPFVTNDGGTTGLNNARIEVDIADGSEEFMWAWGEFVSPILGCGAVGDTCTYTPGDGDLIIHGTASNPFIVSRSYQAVDFGMEMDKFALKDSTYAPGADLSGGSSAQETTIISDLRMEGYFGGFDLIIQNNGNGFTNGIADSKIKINTFFEITEMEYDFDIVGIRYEKMSIHNHRGDLTMFDLDKNDIAFAAGSQGFAQTNTHLYAVRDKVLNLATLGAPTGNNPSGFVDGIAMDTRFRGDMDILHLSFGDTGTSIGELYWTDWDIDTNRVISAH